MCKTTRGKSALLLLASLVAAGCRTTGAKPNTGFSPPESSESPLIIELSTQGVDEKFRNRANPPTVPAVQKNGSTQGFFTLKGQAGYDFDITYVTHIPTSKMKEYVDDSNADEATIREQFDSKYEHSLGLLQLDCSVSPRCEATVQIKGAEQKELNAWLISLDERDATSIEVLFRRTGDDSDPWKPIDFDDRFTGYLKVDREDKKLLPDLVVPLDSIGIASWRYLNPRNPAYVFEQPPTPSAAGAAGPADSSSAGQPALALDDNDTLEMLRERLRNIPVSAKKKKETPDRAQELVSEREAKAINILACKLFAAKRSRDRSDILANAAKIAEEIKLIASAQVPIVGLQLTALNSSIDIVQSIPPAGDQTEYCVAHVPDRQSFQLAAKAIESLRVFVATSLPDQNLSSILAKEFRPIYSNAFNQLNNLADSPSTEPQAVQEATASFVAERAIQQMNDLSARAQAAENTSRLQQRRIRFDNVTADRLFIVTFKLEKCPPDTPVSPNTDTSDIITFTPKDGSGCTGTISVSPESFVDIDASLVGLAPRKILQFTVDFFDQTDDPANSTGYIALTKIDPKDPKSEQEDSYRLGIVAGLTGKSDPFVGTDSDVLFSGGQQDHLSGFARLEGTFLYGTRADAKLNLTYKDGDLGGPEESDKIEASQYQLNTYGTNSLILTFGKFDFAGPSEKIAVNESGQGFRLAYKALSLSYILDRESAENIPNPRDEDKDSWILQLHPIPINWGILRSANLTAVRGQERLNRPQAEEKPAVFPYVYKTYGFDLFFTEPLIAREKDRKFALAGSLAGYYSERDSKVAPDELADGEGHVFLGTVSIPFNFITEESPGGPKLKKKPKYVVTFLGGYGSGDDPGTSVDEGYIGETSAFSRDMIFLNRFSDSSTMIRKSLSNKKYAALQITDNTPSLLRLIAEKMQINENDIVSESTTLRLSNFWFNEPVLGGRDAGQEIDLEFLLEAPKSVKWSLSAAYFQPGKALDSFVQDDAWSVSLGVTINPSINVFR